MSYILDALRRANSERERGSVPTLHADPGPADLASDDDDSGSSPARRVPWTVWLGAGIAIAASLVLTLYRSASRPPAPMPAPAPVIAPAPAPLPQTVAAAPAATVVLEAPPPQPMAAPEPRPAPAPSPTPPAAAALPTQAELPEALRRQIPPLASGGAMYSDTPASRMLILNGQLLREGDKLTPDLVLEEIRLKGAVLNYKGQRFTISF